MVSSKTLFIFIGIVYLILAILSFFTLPSLIVRFIQQKLILKKGSQTYDGWKRVPVPLYNKFYFFNVLNSDEVERNGAKPKLDEIGPFTYQVTLQKHDIDQHPNGTVTFREKRTWVFVRNMSVADDTTFVSTLNAPLATSLSWLRATSPGISFAARLGIESATNTFFIRRTVRELLFEGYPDILTTLGMLLRPELPSVYRGRFGYFFPKNNTDDGVYRVFTGETDINRLNVIDSHNGVSSLRYWKSANCNDLRGATKSEMRSPKSLESGEIHMFNSEICRVLRLIYQSTHRDVHNLLAKRFVLDPNTYKNYIDHPPNTCYHVKRPGNFPTLFQLRNSLFDHDPLPSGVIDLGPCKFGAPIYLSNPHFMDADKIYRDSVVGLNPVKENHTFWFDVEPTTGSTIQVAARIQLNVAINVGQTTVRFRNMPELLMPILWSEYRSHLTPKLADKLHLVQWLPNTLSEFLFCLFFSLGIIFIALAFYLNLSTILKTQKVTITRSPTIAITQSSQNVLSGPIAMHEVCPSAPQSPPPPYKE